MANTREYSKKLLDLVEEGILDRDAVICAMINYLSEEEVKRMMEVNEFVVDEDDEEEFDYE
jgi:hypothetical protein